MSHTIGETQNADTMRFFNATIVNYTVGGETVTATEIGANSVQAVFLSTIPPTKNSLGVPLFPMLDAGKIKLFRFTSGSPVEIASTTALNAVIVGIAVPLP